MSLSRLAIAALLAALSFAGTSRAEVTAEKFDTAEGPKVDVKIDGQPFTQYVAKSGNKPILWPLLGPKGEKLTRSYPIAKAPGETSDHIHHRSLWFTHGEVGGVSFWEEGTKRAGETVHKEFVEVKSGKTASIVTRNDWLGGDGKRRCSDERRLTFGTLGDSRFIDFDIKLIASDGDVEFGDTKEGSFGVRMADTIKVEAEKGGRIVNSEGQTDGAAWGKAAAWVDYHGPVAGDTADHTAGIAILNHPKSFRYPTTWHVRTYGLFAANPFGWNDFKFGNEKGTHTIKAGESITLRYRVILHTGDEKSAKIAEAFKDYAETK